MIVEWWQLLILSAVWFAAGFIWGMNARKPLNHDHGERDD